MHTLCIYDTLQRVCGLSFADIKTHELRENPSRAPERESFNVRKYVPHLQLRAQH